MRLIYYIDFDAHYFLKILLITVENKSVLHSPLSINSTGNSSFVVLSLFHIHLRRPQNTEASDLFLTRFREREINFTGNDVAWGAHKG